MNKCNRFLTVSPSHCYLQRTFSPSGGPYDLSYRTRAGARPTLVSQFTVSRVTVRSLFKNR
jgi:hypothetical protein